MGYMRHHTVCITSWDEDKLKKVYKEAKRLCEKYSNDDVGEIDLVTEIYKGITNGYSTFYIIPDGSKEGWWESDIGDDIREQIIECINSLAYEDGSNAIKYVELFYGDDNGFCEVENYN